MPSVLPGFIWSMGMVFTRLLWFLSLLLIVVPVCAAHEVHLKNGYVIQTDYARRDQDQLTYHQFGGEISIPLSEVDRVIYTDRKGEKAATPVLPSGGGGNGRDLKAVLESKMKPRGPIEQANLAVVSILTAAGSGSGFFLNRDGLIVTNRHVIRGSEDNNEKIEQVMTDAQGQLAEWELSLQREKSRIDQFEKNVKRNRASFKKTIREQGARIDEDQRLAAERSLKERSAYLEDWLRDYTRRKSRFLENKRHIDKQRYDFEQKNRALAGQSRFTITLADGEEVSAILYRTSDRHDLALLKLNGYRTPYLEIADSSSVRLGQQVFAIGAPLQLKNSVTSGVISNFRGEYIQTSSEIYPGNSGGPLVTADGRVVGVNTMKLITEKFEGIGFAIHINRVLSEFSDFFPR